MLKMFAYIKSHYYLNTLLLHHISETCCTSKREICAWLKILLVRISTRKNKSYYREINDNFKQIKIGINIRKKKLKNLFKA